MVIKIKELDEETKDAVKGIEVLGEVDKEVTILISKTILLKVIPQSSIYKTNHMLQKLVKTENLANQKNSEKIKRMVKLNKEISDFLMGHKEMAKFFYEQESKWLKESLSEQKKRLAQEEEMGRQEVDTKGKAIIEERVTNLRELVSSMENIVDANKRQHREKLGNNIKDIKLRSEELQKIEREFGVTLSASHIYCFCPNCLSITEEGNLRFSVACQYCGSTVTSSNNRIFEYLDAEIEKYLIGKWFEDYIAHLLSLAGWHVWVGSFVSGSSGINHEIDILGIKNDYILICETKTGKITRNDVFNFSTKSFDIKSNYAFWFSLERLPDQESRDYMKKTPGLMHMDEIKNCEERGISERISNIDVS